MKPTDDLRYKIGGCVGLVIAGLGTYVFIPCCILALSFPNNSELMLASCASLLAILVSSFLAWACLWSKPVPAGSAGRPHAEGHRLRMIARHRERSGWLMEQAGQPGWDDQALGEWKRLAAWHARRIRELEGMAEFDDAAEMGRDAEQEIREGDAIERLFRARARRRVEKDRARRDSRTEVAGGLWDRELDP